VKHHFLSKSFCRFGLDGMVGLWYGLVCMAWVWFGWFGLAGMVWQVGGALEILSPDF
jgi:hypothetical protein